MAPHAPSPSWCSIGGQRAPALEPARTLRRERPVLRTPCPTSWQACKSTALLFRDKHYPFFCS